MAKKALQRAIAAYIAAFATSAAAMGDKPTSYKPKIDVAKVGTIRAIGSPNPARYMEAYTGAVVRALRAAGFKAGAVESLQSPKPGEPDQISLGGAVSTEYCLEAVWEAQGPGGRIDGGEIRVVQRPDWVTNAMSTVTPDQCAKEMVEKLLGVMEKKKL